MAFIEHIKEATWLSLIIVISNKNRLLEICIPEIECKNKKNCIHHYLHMRYWNM